MQALIWEQWRQVRFPIIGTYLLALLAAGVLYAQMNYYEPTPSRLFEAKLWAANAAGFTVFALVIVAAVLQFTHSTIRDLRVSLPSHMATLPISESRLALSQIAFRLGVVLVLALLLCLSIVAIDRSFSPYVPHITILAVLGYAYTSVIMLTLGKLSPGAAIFLTVLTLPPVLAAVSLFDEFLAGRGVPRHAMTVVATLVYAFVAFCRLSRRQSPRMLRFLMDLPIAWGFEWKRTGALYPLFSLLLLVTFVTIQLVLLSKPFANAPNILQAALNSTLMVGVPTAAVLVGLLLLAREHRDKVTGVSRFLWTRPITVQDVVVLRMRVSFFSVLFTLLILYLMLSISNFAFGISDVEQYLSAAPDSLTLAALLMVTTWLLIWVPYLPICAWLILVVITLGSGILERDFLLAIPIMIYALAFAWLANACWRRKIFDRKLINKFALLGIICTVLAWRLLSEHGMELLLPGVITLPLFALFSQGVLLDRLRHDALFRGVPAKR